MKNISLHQSQSMEKGQWVEREANVPGRQESAIPTNSMQCFLILKDVCDEITTMTHNFWLETRGNYNRDINWKAWDHICKAKTEGGMGSQLCALGQEKLQTAYVSECPDSPGP